MPVNNCEYKMKKSKQFKYFLLAIFLFLAILIVVHAIKSSYFNLIKRDEFKCVNCNVILISIDALRADHLGIYGYERNTSPNIDNFAKKAYVFNNSISQSGSTVYSLPSFHTSKLPITDNLTNGFVLKEEPTTIAEILKEHQYHTYAIVSHEYAKSKYGCAQGFEIFDENYSEYGFADLTTEKVINLLNKTVEQPFFLWIHYREPHSPYNPPERIFNIFNNQFKKNMSENGESRQYYKQKIEEIYAKNISEKNNRNTYVILGKEMHLEEKDINWLKNAYDGNIYFVDEQLGILFNYLNESGILKNTVVIITADHGESLGEHNIFDHNILSYGVIHTPLIVYLPEHSGSIINYPVSNLDILPTILDVTNLNTSLDFRGKSVFDRQRKDYIQFAEYPNYATIIKDGWQLFVNNHSSKTCDPNSDRLFYIINDTDENFNLADENIAMCNYLKNLNYGIREAYYNNSFYEELNKNIINADNETIKKLKAVGYVN